MKLHLSGTLRKEWVVYTNDKITAENMGLRDSCKYPDCGVYGDGSTPIGIDDNGPENGAFCIPLKLERKEQCSECPFGELKKNEYYKAILNI